MTQQEIEKELDSIETQLFADPENTYLINQRLHLEDLLKKQTV